VLALGSTAQTNVWVLISLLRDTDGDGKADVEEIVASGWPPTDVASGGVDATAVTLDRQSAETGRILSIRQP
jgi:hypothetical protein